MAVTTLAFGIGCFHFGIKKAPPFKFKGSEYVNELEKALNSIPNISEVKITKSQNFDEYSAEVDSALPELQKGQGYFPNIIDLAVRFKLFIPYRIQEELADSSAFSENFHIQIFYTFYSPVAFIEIINPINRSHPSSAVVVVRKFLHTELEKSTSTYIRFEFLGPSPFHCNFFIEPKEAEETDKTAGVYTPEHHVNKYGYNNLTFHYKKQGFKDAEEVFKKIISDKLADFGLFYKLELWRLELIFSWEPINIAIANLINIQRTRGLKSIWNRLFKRTRLIDYVVAVITSICDS